MARPYAVVIVEALVDDVLGRRVRQFLAEVGVGTDHLVPVDVATTIALTTFDGSEPDFHFYGEPPSYGLLGPELVDPNLVPGASVLYCGSIALLQPRLLATALAAWSAAGAAGTSRAFDPNVRPRLVTLGAAGALVRHGGETETVPAPRVAAVDATGAGDATMAGLLHGLLVAPPDDLAGWVRLVEFAVAIAALTCEAPGGATAIPTLAQVQARFPGIRPPQ